VQGLGGARLDDKTPVSCVTPQVALEEEERQVKKLLLEASSSLTAHSSVGAPVPVDQLVAVHALPPRACVPLPLFSSAALCVWGRCTGCRCRSLCHMQAENDSTVGQPLGCPPAPTRCACRWRG
jgi:hypothetical protein